MATQPSIDQAKMEEFMHKVVGDLSGTLVTTMCVLGDRLGLFKDLASNGPATSEELADRTGIKERYAREWLGCLASAGYLEYDPASQRFTLPTEQAQALAQELGPMFVGGIHQMLPSWWNQLDRVTQAFQQGGGVPQGAYDDNFWDGLERFTGGWFENLLVQEWLPAVPGVQAKLQRGALVADVGSGSGRALINLAQTFPNSRYIGYDVYGPVIAKATANAEAAGVADRVSFKQLNVVDGLPEQYDLITTFDVIHDSVNPHGVLRAIRQGLKPDGTYLLLEINCLDRLEDNAGPLGAMFYGVSVLYCMTTSLAGGGEGLGTMGMPESKVRAFCTEAGFSSVRPLPIENPFNILYEVKP
ncbi:MAG: class I SAM-dependent methyltransferase [Dehalococcoidia bacterium]